MDSSPDRTQQEEEPRARTHPFLRRTWITVAILATVFALGVGADRVTASMCGLCHEMMPQVNTKATSAHTQIECGDCHEDSLPWYRFPETLAHRVKMLTRNLGPHLSHRVGGAPNPLGHLVTSIPDTKCLECHDPDREVTMHEEGVVIDHEKHSEQNDSCISCHRYTTHRDPEADPELVFMAQCFNCHGQSSSADAPGDCYLCHPESYDLLPESHGPPEWEVEHGDSARVDRSSCLMCHEEGFCRECHGLEMPHPAEWADGAILHSATSKGDREACSRCHGESPDFCTVCHHEDYMASEGTWVTQHPLNVARKGASYCLECHAPTSCVDCHTSGDNGAQPSVGPASDVGPG